MKDDERSLLFIDIFNGTTETVSEDEAEEKLKESKPLADFYSSQYRPSEEQLKLEEENKHILKTRMKLKKETIHESYIQSFNDNYHRADGDISIEDEKEVRGLKRRYPQYMDFVVAHNIYSEYMEKLYEKYGSKEMFELYEKAGVIEEYVPSEPKIKPTKLNKEFKKRGIILSPKSKDRENYVDVESLSIEEIREITKTELIEIEDRIDIFKYHEGKSKKLDELMKEANDSNNRFVKRRDRAMLESNSLHFIAEYFSEKQKFKEEDIDEDIDTNVTLQDLLDDNFMTEEDIQKDNNEMIWYNGQMMRKDVVQENAIYRDLKELGWDGTKIFKRNMKGNKHGIAYDLLKKADKREKKQRKKNKKKNKIKDDFMSTLVFDNGYETFEDFQDDMLNMTAANIFGE